jgi:phosphate starvation-inducible protein PhoH
MPAKKPAADDAPPRARLEVEFEQPHLLGPLFGEFDRNLVAIEDRLGVYIAARGNRVQIEGESVSTTGSTKARTSTPEWSTRSLPCRASRCWKGSSRATSPSRPR